MHNCPFCRIMLPNLEDMWNPIGRGFDGSPASVGGVRSCAWCASNAAIMDTTRTLLQQVAQPLVSFFAALASVPELIGESDKENVEGRRGQTPAETPEN